MIKRRNLDPSLIAWILSQGFGPYVGDIKFACRADSSGSRAYVSWLRDYMGVDDTDIYIGTTAPSLAYAACTAGRGDVVVVMPGWYNLSTGLDMSKRDTHIIGASSMPQIGMYGSPAVLYTSVTTTSNGYTVLMSAEQNSLRNVTVSAYGNHANQKSALKITQSNMWLKAVTIFNFGGATIAGTANATDLWIDTSVPGGTSSLFEDCIIGNSGTTVRSSTSSSVILFGTTGSAGGGQNVFFKNCKILSKAETAGIPIVRMPANYTADRIHLYENCTFYNFWTNWGGSLNQCFDDQCTTTHTVALKNCALFGVTAWQTTDTGYIKVASGPTQGAAGGIGVAPA